MESNLLVNLRKYRPRENTDPLENFITEAFAHLLRSSSVITGALITYINGLLDDEIAWGEGEYQVSTQENFANKFPDLVLKWETSVLVFEHKVRADLHHEQLHYYRQYAAENFNDFRLILITAQEYQHQQSPDCAFCWNNVYSLVKKHLDDVEPEVLWYAREFMALLKSENLGPVAPINPVAIQHYLEAKALDEQLASLFRLATLPQVDWPLKPDFVSVVNDLSKRVEQRFGIEFRPVDNDLTRGWFPGVFHGVIFDGSDHKLSEEMGNRLHVAVVFDFDRRTHSTLRNSATFKDFSTDFCAKIEALNAGWTTVNKPQQAGIQNINWYHPLALLQPMEQFFQGLYSAETQLAHFIEQMTRVQQAIVACSDFKPLVKEMCDEKLLK